MSSGVSRFEDLVAWQCARALARAVYEATRSARFATDPDFSSQMRRAATSVMSNVAEGFERFGGRDFSHFLLIAKSSCAEVRSLLYLAPDIGYLGGDTLELLFAQTRECGRVIGALRSVVRRSPARND